jgi:hypothetical protein
VSKAIKKANEDAKKFVGGRVKQYLNQWKILTSDNEILGIIQGLKS